MFKKSSRRANIRQKRESEEDENHGLTTAQILDIAAPPPIRTTQAISTVVSAHAEEDEDSTFQIKKSSASRRLDKLRKERKERKQKKEKEIEDDSADSNSFPIEDDDKTDIKVKALPARVPIISKQENDLVDSKHSSQISLESPHAQVLVGSDAEWSDDGDAATHTFKSLGDRSTKAFEGIPDSAAIFRARKARERARLGLDQSNDSCSVPGQGEEIQLSRIPIDDTQQYKKEKSRLVREDDDADIDVDDDLGGTSHRSFYNKKVHARINEDDREEARMQFLVHEQGDGDSEGDDKDQNGHESDGEFAKWERSLIRKGVTANQLSHLDANAKKLGLKDFEKREDDMDIDDTEEVAKELRDAKKRAPTIPINLPPALTLCQTMDNMRARAAERAQQLRQKELNAEKQEHHIEDIDDQLKELQTSSPELHQKFLLYQEMVAYCRDLIDCYSEKIQQIEELEARYCNLLGNRTEFFMKRRRQDMKDQYEQCQMLASVATKGAPKIPPDPDKAMRLGERDARRARRRMSREKQRHRLIHNDGESSDDELPPSKELQNQQDLDNIQQAAAKIFQDVIEDYSQIPIIIRKFQRWLAVDRQSFEDAYIGLCLPKLLSPLVRLQQLANSPMEPSTSFAEQSWITDVCCSDLNQLGICEYDVTICEQDDFVQLVPAITEKVILSKWTETIDRAFDPMSSRQCSQLVRNLDCVLRIFGSSALNPKSKPIQKLYNTIVNKIKRSLDEDLFMPLFAKDAIEATSSGARIFIERQFWVAIKALKNISTFAPILSCKAMAELIIDGIVNRHLVFGIQTSAVQFYDASTVQKCVTVCEMLDRCIFTKRNDKLDDDIRPSQVTVYSNGQIEPLAKLVQKVAMAVFRHQKRFDDTVKKLVNLLRKLDATNTADEIVHDCS